MTTTRNTKVPARTVRCAIYTRKSGEEGLEQEFNSLDAQREAGEAYITSQKAEGWICRPECYNDGGYTGGTLDRPALGRLLADIEAGKIDCVVVYKVDRLSRSLMDFAKIMEAFDRHGVSFVSVTQHFNTTSSMGRLTLNILLSFAQFEREIIGERIRDKKAATAVKGKWGGGIPVLGYDVDRSGNSPKLVVNAEEAVQVRRLFAMYQEKGSLLPVVEETVRLDWHSKTWTTRAGQERGGQPFDKCTLYGLLTNPIYAGKIKHKAEVYDGEHQAIVSPEQFAKVQAMLQRNGRTGGVEVRNRYGALLKGLLYCKACGRAMVHTFTGKGPRRYRYYACTHAMKCGWETCPSKSLPAGEIERVVVDEIRCIGRDPDLLADVFRQARQHVEAEVGTLDVERRDLDRQLGREHAEIRRLAVKGPATGATTAKIADLHQRVQRAEARMAEILGLIDGLRQDQIEHGDLVAAFADFDNVWNTLSPREQAKVLQLLVARVDYDATAGSVAIAFHQVGIKALAEGQAKEAAA